MTLSRRLFLHAGLATGASLTLSPSAFARNEMPPWHVGYATAPANGFGPGQMRLVSGKPPAGLAGTLYRNGPAHFQHGEAYATHWFDGDGMVQQFNMGGAAGTPRIAHRGRLVNTSKLKAEQRAGRHDDAPARAAAVPVQEQQCRHLVHRGHQASTGIGEGQRRFIPAGRGGRG